MDASSLRRSTLLEFCNTKSGHEWLGVFTRDPERTSQLPDVDDGFGPRFFALLAHVLLQYACVLPPSECFGR